MEKKQPVRTRQWVCYVLLSEESVADRVLTQYRSLKYKKGPRECLNGVLQTGYTFSRKRDFDFMANGLPSWVHQDMMEWIHRAR